jgi:hypothetical protein
VYPHKQTISEPVSTSHLCHHRVHPPHQTGAIVSITSSARVRANGTKLGRRRVEPKGEARILELKASGDGILKIGRKLGIGTSVVQRVFKQEQVPS